MRKVAVVDDDREIREALRSALADEGYEVTVVPNGLKLLSVLSVDRPDLIVLDVMLSWIDGFELCRALKRNAEFSRIPIVFISAKGSPADVRYGLECGAVEYVTKPFDLDQFLERIEAIIEPTDQGAGGGVTQGERHGG